MKPRKLVRILVFCLLAVFTIAIGISFRVIFALIIFPYEWIVTDDTVKEIFTEFLSLDEDICLTRRLFNEIIF